MGSIELRAESDDPLLEEKMKMLEKRGLNLRFDLHPNEDKCKWLDRVIEAARILNLNQAEYYFLEDDEQGTVINPRNEMAALGNILSVLSEYSPSKIMYDHEEHPLKTIEKMIIDRLNGFGSHDQDQGNVPAPPCTRESEKALLQWATNHGVKSNLYIADFEGYGRGGAAAVDLKSGDLVLEIPSEIIISEDMAMDSDVGQVLLSIEDIEPGVIALLWSIKEWKTQSSKYAPYFGSLPQSFRTGLSFGLEALQAIDGTMLFEQVIQAKEHIRRQYDGLFPELSLKHPEVLPKELYTWDNFLWASELWYSNGVKISFPDGKIRTCLVPLLGLLNHSSVPHVTRYSTVDAASNTLKVYTLRSCQAGRQCFLSYGTHSNLEFACFYGFVPAHNPYDSIPIEFDLPDPAENPLAVQILDKYRIGSSHCVRAKWLSKSALTKGGLPTKLLAALGISLYQDLNKDFNVDQMIDLENEMHVFETITATFEYLLQTFKEQNTSCSEDWDVVLASKYKRSQLETVKSLYEPCSEVLINY